jgi:short subunit dehydrogenase-like uncharacterized protein
MTPSRERAFDLVLFGATGFVGRLVARHLCQYAPPDIRIAVAGRDPARLGSLLERIGGAAAQWPVLFADSAHAGSLNRLAASTRVVATTVGPYAMRGLPLVGACVHHGTHYVDLTGELLFVRESIDCFHEEAIATGAKIVHGCGFDSVPSDLVAHLAASQARIDDTGTLSTVRSVVAMRGGFSGGTLASMVGQLDAIRHDRQARALVDDPYALSPDRDAEPDHEGPHGSGQPCHGIEYDERLDRWVGPFVMAAFNEPMVRRSNALTGWSYGRDLDYREFQVMGSGASGHVKAHLLAAGPSLVAGLLSMPPSRFLMDRLLPSPGEGPDAIRRANGFFRMRGYVQTSQGTRYVATVAAARDPGYDATAVMIGQSALALAEDEDRLPDRYGVLTPATAFGDHLVDRLWDHGFTAEVEHAD